MPWAHGLPWTLRDNVPAPPHLRIVVDGSFVAQQHQGASAFAIFDHNTGAIQHRWTGRVPLHQCASSLEPELWALASAIAAVPRNAELTVWCDNMTAVKWLQQVELMRVESRIEDYRHDKDKTATVLRALIKSLMTEREAPLTVHPTRRPRSRNG